MAPSSATSAHRPLLAFSTRTWRPLTASLTQPPLSAVETLTTRTHSSLRAYVQERAAVS